MKTYKMNNLQISKQGSFSCGRSKITPLLILLEKLIDYVEAGNIVTAVLMIIARHSLS